MNNLLPVVLTEKEILDKLGNDGKGKLKYNMMEGGYMSNDGAVCLILNRSPYNGMLIPMKENDEKTNTLWAKYICKLFGYKYEDKEVSATVEAEPTSIIPEEPELAQAIPTPPEANATSQETTNTNAPVSSAPVSEYASVKINTTEEPIALGDTTGLPNDVWLEWRKHGPNGDIPYTLGGSDVSAVFKVSPWTSPTLLWHIKHGDAPPKEMANEGQLELGHLLEPIVAYLFAKDTGYNVFEDKTLYQHPLYEWALANVDRLYIKPDGEMGILECKSTSYEGATKNWNENAHPYYYELQLRFYMAVLNINEGYLAVLWGNNPERDFVKKKIVRDLEIEREMFGVLQEFIDSLYKGECPEFEGVKTSLELAAFKHIFPKGNAGLPSLELGDKNGKIVKRYAELDEKKKALKKELDGIETDMDELAVKIIAVMKEHEEGVYTTSDGTIYTAKYPTRSRTTVDSAKLKKDHPEIYEECAKTSYSRPFSVKVKVPKV